MPRKRTGWRRRWPSWDCASLGLLALSKQLAPEIPTKSGLMLGLGGSEAEVLAKPQHLRRVDCDRVAMGQYMRPSLAMGFQA